MRLHANIIVSLLTVLMLPSVTVAEERQEPRRFDKAFGASDPIAADAPEATDESSESDESAQSGEVDDARRRRLAVVALGEVAESGSVMQTLLTLLDADGFDVIEEERLRRKMGRSLVPKTSPEIAGQFVGLTTRIGRGIEKFFYKGNRTALEILTPVVNLGMAHPAVLARRPDFARQIFDAGLVMIRAYRNLDRTDDARRLARGLVETFPGFDARADSVPPPVVQLLADQRKVLEETETTMKVRKVDGDGCQAMVNGTPVADSAIAVSPDTPYFVRMECGGGEAPLWRVEVSDGDDIEVPVAAVHPLDFAMQSAGFRDRKQAEAHLQMVTFWADLPRVLGVADAEVAEASESVILVGLRPDGQAEWSDRADEKTVSRMLLRVMRDYDGRNAVAAQSDLVEPREPVDWLSWSLIGGGALAVGAGTWGILAANERAEQLRCSPDSTTAGAGDCAGVTTLRFANSEELAAAQTEVTAVRILSGVGAAVGLGLVGWAAYRLVTDEEPATTALRWDLGVSPHGAHIGASLAF